MPVTSKLMNAVLGDPIKREMKRYQSVIDEINDLEEEISQLSDAELRAKTQEFRHPRGGAGAGGNCRDSHTHGKPAVVLPILVKCRAENLGGRLHLSSNSGCTTRVGGGKNDRNVFCAVACGIIGDT